MAGKESGLGWTTLSLDDGSGSPQAIKNDIHSFDFATPIAVFDVTGVDKSAFERIAGMADFSGTLNGAAWNDDANQIHAVCKTMPLGVARTLTLVVSGQTLANEVLLTDYGVSRGDDGALTPTVPFVLSNGTVPTWT